MLSIDETCGDCGRDDCAGSITFEHELPRSIQITSLPADSTTYEVVEAFVDFLIGATYDHGAIFEGFRKVLEERFPDALDAYLYEQMKAGVNKRTQCNVSNPIPYTLNNGYSCDSSAAKTVKGPY